MYRDIYDTFCTDIDSKEIIIENNIGENEPQQIFHNNFNSFRSSPIETDSKKFNQNNDNNIHDLTKNNNNNNKNTNNNTNKRKERKSKKQRRFEYIFQSQHYSGFIGCYYCVSYNSFTHSLICLFIHLFIVH